MDKLRILKRNIRASKIKQKRRSIHQTNIKYLKIIAITSTIVSMTSLALFFWLTFEERYHLFSHEHEFIHLSAGEISTAITDALQDAQATNISEPSNYIIDSFSINLPLLLIILAMVIFLFLSSKTSSVTSINSAYKDSKEGLKLQKLEMEYNAKRHRMASAIAIIGITLAALTPVIQRIVDSNLSPSPTIKMVPGKLDIEITNTTSNKSSEQMSLLKEVGIFPTSNHKETEEKDIHIQVCEIRLQLIDMKATTAIIIGGHDKFPLKSSEKLIFGSNAGLAQKRADTVKDLLQNGNCVGDAELGEGFIYISLISGPHITGHDISSSKATESDRSVVVYGIRGL